MKTNELQPILKINENRNNHYSKSLPIREKNSNIFLESKVEPQALIGKGP
jgi:hypothetical protein